MRILIDLTEASPPQGRVTVMRSEPRVALVPTDAPIFSGWIELLNALTRAMETGGQR